MVALLLTVIVPLVLALGLLTAVVGTWRHLAGSHFAAELHRQLASDERCAAGFASLLVVHPRTAAGSSRR